MFGDERAPAPLDRPLDLDRRWRGAPPARAAADGAAAAIADEELSARTPPPWWRSAGGDTPDPHGPTPAPGDGHPGPEQMPLPAVELPLPGVEAYGIPSPAAQRAAGPRRLLAAALDLALVSVAGAAPVLLAVRPAPIAAAGTSFAACAGFLALLGFTYATLGHALMGATVGKRLLGLRVEGPGGTAPGLARSVARSALAVAGAAALGAGVVIGLLSRRGQALHDRAVGTVVVRAPGARG
jgi:uncharacterized RDD family membrane protein YckC